MAVIRRYIFTNNSAGELVSNINSSQLTIPLLDSSMFPQPNADEQFAVTLANAVLAQTEVLLVTNNNVGTNTLTVAARGAEAINGVAGVGFNFTSAGTLVESRLTAGQLTQVLQLGNTTPIAAGAFITVDAMGRIIQAVGPAGVSEQSFTGLTAPTITLTTMTYIPGVDNVWVFFNGSKLASTDFTQTNATTITLGFTPVAGDILVVSVGQSLDAVGPPQQVTTTYYYPSAGETVVSVPSYTQGGGKLTVFVNGVLQVLTVDYTETSSTSITMTTALAAGDVVILVLNGAYNVTLVSPGVSEQSFTGLTAPTITLTSISYLPGIDNVWVFFNGLKLASTAFTQTNSTTITLGFTPVAADVFAVVVGQSLDINANAPAYAAIRDQGYSSVPFTVGSRSTNLVFTNYPPASNMTVAANRITVQQPGVYRVDFWISLNNPTAATRELYFTLRKNGVAVSLQAEALQSVVSGRNAIISMSVLDAFVINDYVEVYQNIIAGEQTLTVIDSHLSMHRIGS